MVHFSNYYVNLTGHNLIFAPVAVAQVNLVPHSEVISSTSVEEAKTLLYGICFSAVIARYQEMEHSQLIGLKSLDRLQVRSSKLTVGSVALILAY